MFRKMRKEKKSDTKVIIKAMILVKIPTPALTPVVPFVDL